MKKKTNKKENLSSPTKKIKNKIIKTNKTAINKTNVKRINKNSITTKGNEKDVALKPIEISFELKEKNDEDYLTLKNEIKEIKTTSNDKIISSYELKSNILIIESISENTSESNFNARIQKEIENINIQKRI